jgi:hypothetical protein
VKQLTLKERTMADDRQTKETAAAAMVEVMRAQSAQLQTMVDAYANVIVPAWTGSESVRARELEGAAWLRVSESVRARELEGAAWLRVGPRA